MQKKPFFYILIRSWNSYEYFDKCVGSVFNQTYKNFQILFVDDWSKYTTDIKNQIKSVLKNHHVVFNKKRRYSVYNAYEMIHEYAVNDDGVIFNLDGDDWLFDKSTLSYLSKVYARNKNCLLTYGECVLWDGNKYSKPSRFEMPSINIPYPKDVISNRSYRKYPFLPLHPRTWKVWLFKKIKAEDFKRPDGSWLQFAEDQAIFYPMLEMARGRFKAIKKPLYVYNVATRYADAKENLTGLLKDELIVRRKNPYGPIY